MFKNDMVEEKTWKEFTDTKMLWFANRMLHVFGWAICIEENNGSTRVFPARVKFRGFPEEVEAVGYIGISQFMRDNSKQLLEEAKS